MTPDGPSSSNFESRVVTNAVVSIEWFYHKPDSCSKLTIFASTWLPDTHLHPMFRRRPNDIKRCASARFKDVQIPKDMQHRWRGRKRTPVEMRDPVPSKRPQLKLVRIFEKASDAVSFLRPSPRKFRSELMLLSALRTSQEWWNRTPNATNFSFAGLLVLL